MHADLRMLQCLLRRVNGWQFRYCTSMRSTASAAVCSSLRSRSNRLTDVTHAIASEWVLVLSYRNDPDGDGEVLSRKHQVSAWCFSARDVSIDAIFWCGCGERRSLACNIRGSVYVIGEPRMPCDLSRDRPRVGAACRWC